MSSYLSPQFNIYSLVFFTIYGYIMNSQRGQLPVGDIISVHQLYLNNITFAPSDITFATKRFIVVSSDLSFQTERYDRFHPTKYRCSLAINRFCSANGPFRKEYFTI